MQRIALFPGTFDPITIGHLDIINRAANIFPNLLIAVAANQSKRTFFSQEERIAMIQEAVGALRYPDGQNQSGVRGQHPLHQERARADEIAGASACEGDQHHARESQDRDRDHDQAVQHEPGSGRGIYQKPVLLGRQRRGLPEWPEGARRHDAQQQDARFRAEMG